MLQFPADFNWLYPWVPIPNDYKILPSFNDESLTNWDHETGEIYALPHETLVAELKRELPPGHQLEALEFEAVGVYELTHMDFLFVTSDEFKPLACVHLTFRKEKETPWPMSSTFDSLDSWIEEMSKDHRRYLTER